MPTYLYPVRQLDSKWSLLLQNLTCLDPTTVGFCCDPWRRMRLTIHGEKLSLDGKELPLTPAAEAHALAAGELVPYDWLWLWPWPAPAPPGPAVELRVPPHRFAMCAPSEAERDLLLHRLRDAIDLSHGPSSPYAEWSFGAVLGQGTFGTVRAVTHRASGEQCAVKVLSRRGLESLCNATRALAREKAIMVRLQAQLGHAHVPLVQLRQYREWSDDVLVFLTPRCHGDVLGLLRTNRFDETQAAALTAGALLAIAALHRAGIVHLDVKPQNLLYRTPPSHGSRACFVTPAGELAELFLADYGCARELRRADGGDEGGSESGGGAGGRRGGGDEAPLPAARGGWCALRNDGGGTLYFTPPEILEEELQATSADVWAAGCVLFSVLHRRPPFVREGESEEMARLRILRAEPLYAPAAGEASVVLSTGAAACLRLLLTRSWRERPSAEEALRDPWLLAQRGGGRGAVEGSVEGACGRGAVEGSVEGACGRGAVAATPPQAEHDEPGSLPAAVEAFDLSAWDAVPPTVEEKA